MRALAIAFVIPLLAGCIDGMEDSPEDSVDSVLLDSCGTCFEPSMVRSGEYLFATASNDERLFRAPVSTGVFVDLTGPSMENQGDVFLQEGPDGQLWWSSLVRRESIDGSGIDGVLVARSDDAGESWTDVQTLHWASEDAPVNDRADRQWLAFVDDDVLVFCTCPGAAAVQFWRSDDGGASFSGPELIPTPGKTAAPIGRPAVQGQILVAPYFVGAAADVDPSVSPSEGHPLIADGVAASVSNDGGLTWSFAVLSDSFTEPAARPICCWFPNSFADDEGFLLSWVAADGSVRLATSSDGMEWAVDVAVPAEFEAASPHAWPVRVAGRPGIAWFDGRGTTDFFSGGDRNAWFSHLDVNQEWVHLELGMSPKLQTDFAFATADESSAWIVFPSPDGMVGRRVAF